MNQQFSFLPTHSVVPPADLADRLIEEPDEATVLQIIQMMEKLLKIRRLTAESRFVDLTSDIRKAFLFLREFRRRFDFDLPLSAFFDAPTVADLARIATTRETPPLARLVLLRKGDERVPPLFLVPGLGGVVFELLALSKEIAYGGTIYAFSAPGLDGVDPPPSDTVRFGQENFDLARHVYPGGPFRFLGHSAGGVTAFEMARHAAARGAKVDFFGVLDTNFAERAWPFDIWLSFMVRRAGKAGSSPRDTAGEQQKAQSEPVNHRLGKAVSRLAASVGRVPDKVHRVWRKIKHRYLTDPSSVAFLKSDPYYIPDLPPKFQRVRDAAIGMAARYKPTFYDGELYLFQAEFGDALACDPVLTWSRLVREIILLPTPGDHITMLSPPHVSAVASKVSICLAEIEQARRQKSACAIPA
ncbi:MAG TPA: thioesterase domain-containing protein [Terriglobia bacterium]|nr:thioesterase domain-containing protein [Terriglobia bacterium]